MSVWIASPEGAGLAERAQIPVDDRGFLLGDGVYETMRVESGRVEFRRRHIDRLERSARQLRLNCPDRDVIESAIDGVLSAVHVDLPGRLRLTLTSGRGGAGLLRGGDWRLVATWTVLTEPARTIEVATSKIRVNQHSPLAGVKSTSAAERALAFAEARARGAGEALMLNLDGQICECASSNIFVVKQGVALTPPLSSGALPGVVRGVLLETAGAKVQEVTLTLADLSECSAVFITNSIRGITPVSRLDQHSWPRIDPKVIELVAGFETERRAND